MLVKQCSFDGSLPKAEADESSKHLPGTKSRKTFTATLMWCSEMSRSPKIRFGLFMEQIKEQELAAGQQCAISTSRLAMEAPATRKRQVMPCVTSLDQRLTTCRFMSRRREAHHCATLPARIKAARISRNLLAKSGKANQRMSLQNRWSASRGWSARTADP